MDADRLESCSDPRRADPHRRLHGVHLLAAPARGTPTMSHLPKTDSVTYLRTLALGRIVLDNVPNLQSSWVMMGHKVGQVARASGPTTMAVS
jgi:2-iminoacetate synthase ThiH